jgi:YihY family inner membrane protein
MNLVERLTDRVDRLQRGRPWLAFPLAVAKKFGDDQAGNLAALIAYYAFAAIFPMLLVLVTLLQILLRHNQALQQQLINSALHAYPVIGPELAGRGLHALHSTGIALVVGLVAALLAARGVALAMQNALNTVWAVPPDRRPSFPWSAIRAVIIVVVIGMGQSLAGFLSGVAGGLGHVISGAPAEIGVIGLSFAVNLGLFWLAFRLATAGQVSWRDLRLAAILSAVSWQVLLSLGGWIVGHLLHRSSALYGVFGVVLGLLAWLYLQAQVTLYASEAAAVLAWRLWPRSLAAPPTAQDEQAYQYYERGQRQPPAARPPEYPGPDALSD